MDKIATFDDLGLGVRHEMRTFDRFRTTENLNKRVHGRNCSSSRREREREFPRRLRAYIRFFLFRESHSSVASGKETVSSSPLSVVGRKEGRKKE